MTYKDLAEHASQSAVGWIVAACLLFVGGLVRRIFTNQQTIRDNQAANDASINLLRLEIAGREELRKQDRQHFNEKIDDLKASIEHQSN